ncbi:MAG: hypothetical protein H0U76_13935 [Ktedonobacteraceae bacterium]|nr:hypothetical protein [Ktedonobacteraceae bacterium]
MSEQLRGSNQLDIFAGEIVEVIRDTHPGIVNGWDEEIRQALLDDEPMEDWPDYHTVAGARYWLTSEIQLAQSFMRPDEPESYTREQEVIDICQAALLLFDYLEYPSNGNHT